MSQDRWISKLPTSPYLDSDPLSGRAANKLLCPSGPSSGQSIPEVQRTFGARLEPDDAGRAYPGTTSQLKHC